MPDYYVGFFVLPASSLDAMHRIEEEANEAFDAWRPDRSWRLGLVFQRAAEVAVASEIVAGPCIPLTNGDRSNAYFRIRHWLMARFLDENPRAVLDPEQFEALTREFERTCLDEFLAWNAEPGSRRLREAAPERLVELYKALERLIHARPSGPHGFVYIDFWESDRHPPEPPPEPPEPTISRADAARRTKMLDFSIQAEINRQRRPWWPGAPDQEGRALLGLVAPEQIPALAEAHRQAIEKLRGDEVIAGLAALREEVIPRIEAALLEPVIETVGAPVQALFLLRFRLERVSGEEPPAVCSPEQAVTLEAQLDQYIDDEAIEWIWGLERHWTREQVRETYQRLRELLGRAIAGGHGFVWLIDFHQL